MDAPECQSRELSLSEIRTLSWKAERLLPECMEALVQARKPILFELACAPDSVLTKQMQQITNRPSSAQRFAYWNGYDIGTNTGVRAILVAITERIQRCTKDIMIYIRELFNQKAVVGI